MKISIAMATYNGAKYIKEQLESLVQQTRLPDEVIVNDDCSTDDTINILEKIKKTAPFPVKIYSNEKNIGFVKNFGLAIERCRGDVIFLSDQDDFWFPNRIDYIYRYFEKNPSALVIVNDAEITTEDLTPTGYTKFGQKKAIGVSNKKKFITGCCTAFKADLIPIICPIPFNKYPHDAWIHSIGELLSGRMLTEKPLLYFRRHQTNTSNPLASRPEKVSILQFLSSKNRGNPYYWLEERLYSYELFWERLNNKSSLRLSKEELGAVKSRVEGDRKAVSGRLAVLSAPFPYRIILATKFYMIGGYNIFSGSKSFIKDCFFS